MRIIAHRANLFGPDKNNENSPAQIIRAIEKKFDVEVDVWVIDNAIYFGHDEPIYECSEQFVLKIIEKTWFHCKNSEALYYLPKKFPGIKYFWHQSDYFTLTSNQYIWTYPGKSITDKSILVLPELLNDQDSKDMISKSPYGVCTDWPFRYELK